MTALSRLGGLLLLGLAAGALPVAAQSVSTGALDGVVRDSAGTPLAEAEVTLRERVTGISRTGTTSREGRFQFVLLRPGSYEVYVERLGFRPRLVTGLTIEPEARLEADIAVDRSLPPVTTIDTVAYVVRAIVLAPVGWRSSDDLAELADPLRRLNAVARIWSGTGDDIAMQGLPGRYATLGLDGVPLIAARHAQADGGALDGVAFPLELAERATLYGTAGDIAWPSVASGLLAASSRAGARRLGGLVSAEGGSADRRAAVTLWGPVIADTAGFVVGIVAQRHAPSRPALWASDSATFAVDTIARDTLGTDLSAYLRETESETELLQAFGRFAWQLTPAHAVTARASAGRLTASDVDVGAAVPASLGPRLVARAFSASGELSSVFTPKISAELRVGVDATDRSYAQLAAPPFTSFSDIGVTAGTPGAVPGQFKRTTVRGTIAGHYLLGAHRLTAGAALQLDAHDQTFANGRAGAFAFGGANELRQRRGAFYLASSSAPVAAFDTREMAWFAQDVWTPAPGLELRVGLRATKATVPVFTDVRPNQAWFDATGLANVFLPVPKWQVRPRLGFTWALGPRRSWVLRGDASSSAGEIDPALFAEVLTNDGAIAVRRGFGPLGAWPAFPDTIAAPRQGSGLTLLHPSFEQPRTRHAGAGLSRALGDRGTLTVRGEYRHTDFLPRRRDLNLRSTSTLRDQDGRAVFGTLRQEGTLVGPQPGTNRRFAGFDAVAGVDPSGYSDYVSMDVVLERRVSRGVSLWASYTWSRTQDNWLGARGGDPALQLPPFADSAGAADWADGRSDFDVPHRVAFGAEAAFGGFRVLALWRWRSGLPFTPGFRAGVDMNGDGVAGNDPAFVSDSLPGDTTGALASVVVGANECLRAQVGRFAARNSCRAPSVMQIDVRVAFSVFNMGGRPAEIFVDALDLAATDAGPVDQALYVVDPAGTITTTAAGVVTVPLRMNPNFGERLVRRVPAATVRAGVRIGF